MQRQQGKGEPLGAEEMKMDNVIEAIGAERKDASGNQARCHRVGQIADEQIAEHPTEPERGEEDNVVDDDGVSSARHKRQGQQGVGDLVIDKRECVRVRVVDPSVEQMLRIVQDLPGQIIQSPDIHRHIPIGADPSRKLWDERLGMESCE